MQQLRGAPQTSQNRFGNNAAGQPILGQGSKPTLNTTSPLRQNQTTRPGLNATSSSGLSQLGNQAQKRTPTPTLGGDGSRPSPRMESRNAGSGRETSGPSVWEMAPSNQSFLLPQRQGGASPIPPRGGKGMAQDVQSHGKGGPMLEESSIPATSSRGAAQLSGAYGAQREMTPPGVKRSSTPQGLPGREARSPIGHPRGREQSPSGLQSAGSSRGLTTNSEAPRRPSQIGAFQANSGTVPSADMQSGTFSSQNGYNFQQSGSGPSVARSGMGMQSTPSERSATTRSVAAPPSASQLELEAKNRELREQNAYLEKKLDEDGSSFLEALLQLEEQNEELQRQNKKLKEEKESGFSQQGDIGEARARIAKLEQEQEDVLSQMDSFEKEKEEDLRRERAVSESLRKQLQDAEQDFKRRFSEMESERAGIIEMVSGEGKSAQARIDKLIREKEELNSQLAKALANAEAGGSTVVAGQDELGMYQIVQAVLVREGFDPDSMKLSELGPQRSVRVLEVKDFGDRVRARIEEPRGWISILNKTTGVRYATKVSVPNSGQNLSEANNQLRTAIGEREALKDEVTNKNGQLLLLQSQIEIKDRKLRIADMENAMLKSELDVLRRKG